ncbi:MAG TPA: preQ(1) synthase [Rectinemataceae bacterium]|nr:preQ(1) synthase [Rectinemataceae bacterium]
MSDYSFDALGQKGSTPKRKLEVFPTPATVRKVVLESDEVTSLCPVTGQPDWETVRIEFEPGPFCIESKSLKLYLWSFREEGAFCEALAARIAKDIYEAAEPRKVTVSITQKPRGGIAIFAEASLPEASSPEA